MAKVCSELARGFVRKSTNDKVRSELVRLFGVCSELARSSFGVFSELVHREPGASEKRLPRKTVLLRIM